MPETTKPQYSAATRFFFSSDISKFLPIAVCFWVAALLLLRLFFPAKAFALQPLIDVVTCNSGLATCAAVMAGCACWGAFLYNHLPLDATANTVIAYGRGAIFIAYLLVMVVTLPSFLKHFF